MPERGSHYRRSHSDTSFRFGATFDDLLLFDPSDLDISNLPLPSPPAGVVPMAVDPDESGGKSRSPVDSDFFAGERRVRRHRHSNSMDGSSTTSFEADLDGMKKAMPPDRLAELALMDPKRAERFINNITCYYFTSFYFLFEKYNY